ncbi:endocytosis ankyrin repeat protein [Fusarium pseudoanthophilum]|uniref:Endocytosis ankyrin repeat protein n=1 Tax=Fusarium pseudoanthophilum TaxID=48495 RepID=A0A8H5UT56_9HYPO|nr:endocytosis ankyrin repeat protein [Fusarium pseudoanthophilum]
MQAREQTDPMMPAQRLLGSPEHPLVSLTIQELEEILEELNQIVEKYSRSRKAHGPKRYTDKVKWLSDAGKIEELRERAQATKSNLHMAITFRVSSMVDRGNVRQEVNSSQALGKYIAKSGAFQVRHPQEKDAIVSLMQVRKIGYELKSYYTKGGKPEVDIAIDKTAAAVGEVLDALQEQPWAIDELDEYGMAPIHIAVLAHNFEGLEQLMAAEADVNRQTPAGFTPLMTAAADGNDTILQKLLGHSECEKRVRQCNVQGMTAIHFAVESGSTACVRLLLEAGAPASKTDDYGRTPMHYLAWGNQEDQQEIYDTIKLLQNFGADIESKDPNGITPVLCACQKGNISILSALARAGASLGAMDLNRNGIIHVAALSNNFDIVHYLAEQDLEGIDPQLRVLDQGSTPLGSLRWIFDGYFMHCTIVPSQEQQQTFIQFYFKLLIRGFERHMSTLRNIQQAIQDRDTEATAGLLDILIERNEAGFRQELVGWYRGLKFYVSDGQWDKLKEAICEEYEEISEKTERAAIARGKTLTDPEMEEFF